MKNLKVEGNGSDLEARRFLLVGVDLAEVFLVTFLAGFLAVFLAAVLVLPGVAFGENLLIKSDIFIVLIMLLQEWHIGLIFLMVLEPPLASAFLCPIAK